MIRAFINSEFKDNSIDGFDIDVIREYKIYTTEDKTFITDRFSILLIKSGNFKINIQGITIDLVEHDIIIIPEESVCIQLNNCKKLKIFIIAFTSDFAIKNFIKKEIVGLLCLFMQKNAVKVALKDTDFKVLANTVRLICLLKNQTKMDLLKMAADFFFYELASVYSNYITSNKIGFSHIDSLVLSFLSLLSNHGTKKHNAKFYAEYLCVTAGYLNKIVKQKTGRTIKALIAEIIIGEAKKMLCEYHMSIVAISQELEFSNVSAFSTFFKKHSSISPSEYRMAANK